MSHANAAAFAGSGSGSRAHDHAEPARVPTKKKRGLGFVHATRIQCRKKERGSRIWSARVLMPTRIARGPPIEEAADLTRALPQSTAKLPGTYKRTARPTVAHPRMSCMLKTISPKNTLRAAVMQIAADVANLATSDAIARALVGGSINAGRRGWLNARQGTQRAPAKAT